MDPVDAIDDIGEHDQLAPDWLRWIGAVGWRFLVTLALAAFLLLIAITLSTTTVAVIFSILVATAFSPYVLAWRARGWSRSKAAAVGTVGATAIVLGATILIALALVPYIVQIQQSVQAAISTLETATTNSAIPPEAVSTLNSIITGLESWLSTQATAITNALATLGTIGMLSLFTLFFLLQDGDKAWAWILRPANAWRRATLAEAGQETLVQVGGYLRGSSVNAAVDSLSAFVFLTILGVPSAGPLAVIVLIAGFVPYVGNFLANLLLLLLAWASGGLTVAAILLGLIALTNIVKRRYLSPLLYGRTVNLHPAVILIALPAGMALGGLVGLVLAVPVAAFLPALWTAAASVLNEGSDRGRSIVSGGPVVPGWLDRLGQWSWRLLILLGLAWLMIEAAAQVPLVVGPLTVAIILAATLLPAVNSLLHRGWPRGRASIVVAVTAWAIVVGVCVLSFVVLVKQGSELVAGSTKGSSALAGVDWPGTITAAVGSGFLEALRQVVEGLVGLFVGLVLSAVLSFFVLRDGSLGWAAIIRRLPGWRRDIAGAAGDRAIGILGGYMISTGVLSLFGAVTTFVIMEILGLPLAAPLAILAFFLGFIPYIGSALATLAAFLIAVAFGTTQDIVIMGIWTVVFNIVQGSVIAPLIYGKAVNLHPAIVLLAIPAGGQLAGVVGMFLAVPVLGVVAATWRSVLQVMGDQAPSESLATVASSPGPPVAPATTGADPPQPASADPPPV